MRAKSVALLRAAGAKKPRRSARISFLRALPFPPAARRRDLPRGSHAPCDCGRARLPRCRRRMSSASSAPAPAPAPAAASSAAAAAAAAASASAAALAASCPRMKINGVDVAFVPGRRPFPAQLAVMGRCLAAFAAKENALLESPTGTGKTLALLTAALAWQVRVACGAARRAKGCSGRVWRRVRVFAVARMRARPRPPPPRRRRRSAAASPARSCRRPRRLPGCGCPTPPRAALATRKWR